jgi:hypothetical protein
MQALVSPLVDVAGSLIGGMTLAEAVRLAACAVSPSLLAGQASIQRPGAAVDSLIRLSPASTSTRASTRTSGSLSAAAMSVVLPHACREHVRVYENGGDHSSSAATNASHSLVGQAGMSKCSFGSSGATSAISSSSEGGFQNWVFARSMWSVLVAPDKGGPHRLSESGLRLPFRVGAALSALLSPQPRALWRADMPNAP